MKLFMHIGTEKTGTTSLQNWLNLNSKALELRGFFYSHVMGRPNNRKLSVACKDPEKWEDGFASYKINNTDDHNIFSAKLSRDFALEVAEAKEASMKNFIISNEHLQSRLNSQEMVNRVGSFVNPHFEEIEVILYLRPQIEFLLSRFSTNSRGGAVITDKSLQEDQDEHYYDYLSLYRRWRSVFRNISVIPYNRNKDTVASFLRTVGLENEGFDLPKRDNTGISIYAMALVNNIKRPAHFDGKPNPSKNINFGDFERKESPKVSRQQAIDFQKRFRESNMVLTSLVDSISESDLEPNLSNYSTGNINILDLAPWSEELNKLFYRLQ